MGAVKLVSMNFVLQKEFLPGPVTTFSLESRIVSGSVAKPQPSECQPTNLYNKVELPMTSYLLLTQQPWVPFSASLITFSLDVAEIYCRHCLEEWTEA